MLKSKLDLLSFQCFWNCVLSVCVNWLSWCVLYLGLFSLILLWCVSSCILVIDGSYDGTHKLSIDISGLIYDWKNDGWWKPRIVRSAAVTCNDKPWWDHEVWRCRSHSVPWASLCVDSQTHYFYQSWTLACDGWTTKGGCHSLMWASLFSFYQSWTQF